MSFKSDLYEFLIADAGLSALVGSRVYPTFAGDPEAARPYITYSVLFSAPEYHQTAYTVNNTNELTRETIQFDLWGDGPLIVANVEAALYSAISGYSGLMNGNTEVRRVFKKNQIDNFESPSDGQNDSLYRITVDYDFWYNRA